MVAGNSSEWLPPGFEERIEVKNGRKTKCYYNIATGMKYNSKKDVIVYLKTQEIFHDPQEINNDETGVSFNNEVDAMSVETNKSPEWLPDGWRMEEKPRKKGSNEGSKYKIYIDLSTGNKFYSRLAVTRYLKNVEPNDGMVEQPKLGNLNEPSLKPDTPSHSKSLTEAGYIPEKCIRASTGGTSAGEQASSEAVYIPGKKMKGQRSFTLVASESTSADGLPPGTSVKETRTRKSENKIRKEPLDNGSMTVTKPDVPLEHKSITDDDCIPKTRKRKHSFIMVASESTKAEGLPPGWIKEIKTSKSGNKIRKDPYYIDPVNGYVFHSKKDALRYLETNDIGSCAIVPKSQKLAEHTIPATGNLECKSRTDDDCIAEKKKNSNQNFPTSANESTYVEGLPPGWIKEIQTSKSGSKIRKDTYYIDPANCYMFRSKKDVMRYLETNDIGSCAITPKRRELDSLKLIKNKIHLENVAEPCLKVDTPMQSQSMIDTARDIKKLKNRDSSTEVATEITSADGLPPGWIKEIKSIKSGNKIRKDPYYTDPVSGYIFRSKKDALRFLDTNDIGSCAITPKKRESNDPKLINRKTTHLSPTNKKLPVHHEINEKNFSGGESTGHGGNNSGVKSRAGLKTKISKTGISGGGLQDSTMVVTESTLVDELPPGWIKEIKTSKSGNKIRKDPYYTDPVSGYVFRSKKDVLRFLETKDIGSCAITPKKRESDDLKLINRIPLNKSSCPSKRKLSDRLKAKHVSGEKSNGNCGDSSSRGSLEASMAEIRNTAVSVAGSHQASTTVATEITPADGLPPGWTKELKTTKCGDKIRKDPYYVDPVSGYIFRSKKDALRFLETNDIRSCAITPKKRESDDLKLIKNKTTTSFSPSNQKLSDQFQTQNSFFPGVDSSNIKSRAASNAKVSNAAFAVPDSLKDFTAISAEITSADGLPPGWMKEIKTSKSGNKIRKDPYYIDSGTGYIFRSRKDALRFLETNDISSCAITPKKMEFDDLQLIKNKTTSLSLSSPKFSDHLETKDKLFSVGGSNVDGEDSSGVKGLSASRAKSSKIAFAGADSFEDPTMVASEITSADGLPPGWLKEIKICKSGNKIRKDPYYTDPVTGYVFRSKRDALRFLETNDIGSCAIRPKKRESDDLKLINSEAPSSSPTNQKLSDHIETQHKLFSGGESNDGGDSSVVKSQAESKVSVEITSADGLPPGWMKEVKISYSGNKSRKDPLYYLDPVDGYIFRSRKDVLRFLETNDIGSCAMKPMKRKSDDQKLMKNNTASLSPINRESSDQLTTMSEVFSGGEPKSGASKAKISNIGFDGASTFTSEDKLPESGTEKQTDGTRLRPRKSVKRRDLNLSSHASKRFSKSEPEIIPHMDLNEQPLGVSIENSSVYSTPSQSALCNEKEVAICTLSGEATHLEEQLNKDGKLPSEETAVSEREPLNKNEKLFAQDKGILTGPGEGKAHGDPLNAATISQNPGPSYAFGEPWTDPCLQFAFKTLTGEITVEETLSSPGIPENQEVEGIVAAEPKVPTIFESDIPPGFETMEQSMTAEKLPGNPSTSSPAGSTMFQVDEIPPGFESVVQNNTVDNFSPSP